MSDDPLDQLDVRVITITLQPPLWIPVIDYGDDFDDMAALGVLEIATAMHYEQLMAVCLPDEDDDADD